MLLISMTRSLIRLNSIVEVEFEDTNTTNHYDYTDDYNRTNTNSHTNDDNDNRDDDR